MGFASQVDEERADMPDELINENEQEETQEETPEKKPARSDNRFKDLSEKVETTAKERDEAKAAAEAAQKEVEFYKGFSKGSTKYPEANDHQDKIREKVMSGYDMEDAIISVLAKAGKLNAPQVQRESPAGGSASTAVRSADDKPVSEMTTAEKRERLIEWERTNPGELSKTLRNLSL